MTHTHTQREKERKTEREGKNRILALELKSMDGLIVLFMSNAHCGTQMVCFSLQKSLLMITKIIFINNLYSSMNHSIHRIMKRGITKWP